jgi:5-formyltetrahydrofolate cyclo-ligase
MDSKTELRRLLRRRRAALSARQRRHASQAAARHLLKSQTFLRARRLALYHATNNELDAMPIAKAAWRLRKACYLPVLHPFLHGRLVFVRWQPDSRMRPNRFGIPEPADLKRTLPTRELDLVIVPLLGVDTQGTRLGMGGGFYDRSFAFRLRCKAWHKPRLVGFACEDQRVDRLPRNAWDIRLDAVCTEKGFFTLRS